MNIIDDPDWDIVPEPSDFGDWNDDYNDDQSTCYLSETASYIASELTEYDYEYMLFDCI